MAKVASDDLAIWQYDVKTAYLEGELEELILVRLTKELQFDSGKLRFLADLCLSTGDNYGGQILHLANALPGLCQSASSWNQTLDKHLQSIGIERSKHAPAVQTRGNPQSRVYLVASVDDLTLFGKQEHLQQLKSDLEQLFELKFLGNANNHLSVTISRIGSKVLLSQEGIINKVLAKHVLEECSPRYTPLDVGAVNALSGEFSDNELLSAESSTTYKSMVRSILYDSIVSRLDMVHTADFLSWYSAKLTKAHLMAAKNMLRYLEYTKNM